MAPEIGSKTNLGVDQPTKTALVAIMGVLAGSDYNYFAGGFEVSPNTSNRTKIKVRMTVIVPAGQIESAAKNIKNNIKDDYDVDFGTAYKWVNVYLGEFEKDKTRIKIELKEESVPKTFDKPSGVNKGSGGGSGNTKIVESAQCLYCDLAFNVYNAEIVEDSLIDKVHFEQAFENIEVDATLEEMLSMASAWKKSSILGANKLLNTLPRGNYKFYRNKGVDVAINEAYNRIKNDKVSVLAENISDSVPASEDKWNPADIWIAKDGFNINEIKKHSTTGKGNTGLVLNFNKFLIDKFNDKELIGVSLKKITGNADIEPMNLTKDRKIAKVGFGAASFNYDSLDTYIDFKSGSSTSIQFRNFSGSKGSWQGEVGIKGSSAKHGKIGGGAIWEVIKSHGITVGNGIDNNTQLYTDLGNPSKTKDYAEKIYDLLNSVPADDRKMGSNRTQEVNDIISNGQRWMYSKYLGLSLIDKIKRHAKSDEIVQDIYLYASSQHTLSGVYYKLT